MAEALSEPAKTEGAGRFEESAARQRASLVRRFRGPIGASAMFVVIVTAWHLTVANGLVSEIILPPPIQVARALIDTVTESFFYAHLWITTVEVLLGFFIGSTIGFSLGAALGVSALLREVSYPYIIAFQGLPKVVLAPVFITAFGFGITSKVVMAIAICFFPVLINTMAGLTSVDPDARRLLRSLNANELQMFTKLALPHSLPLVFAGLKTALTLALVGAIVGEFVGASEGIGVLLATFAYQLQVARVWALTIILALLGVILFLVIEWLDGKIVFWRSERDISAGA
ncbi:MAG: ABC transporter permease subunit [Nitriliruptorales bacterium]|nr:ABC transporter permease subunit [Nitriliruptorales bacterium]